MKKLKTYLKNHGIRVSYLIEETGYHRGHISRVLNGHKGNSPQFARLIKEALQKRLDKKVEELHKKKKEIDSEQECLNEAIKEICKI